MEHYTYLAHYGIPKQQWGVRRFQNPDGSLTPEGRRRYGVYAMEGAKRAGLLGAAVGKAVGVYKERKEAKQKELAERFEKENAKLESESMYDVSINNRRKPLDQRVKDTEDQLQKICDAHVKRLSAVMETIPGQDPFDNGDALYDGSFAIQLATRINERFDVDGILDQHMDEYVHDYRNGVISKKEFKQHYETELNDYAARVVDTYTLDDLKKVAKTFVDTDGYNAGEYGDASPKTGWKDYLKRVDSWEGVDSNSLNQQNSKKSSQYAVKNPPKSSGRYTTGSKETSDQMWKRLESDPGYIKVKDKSKSGNGGQALVKIENKSTAAVSLSYLGYSDKEIAKILGVSVDTLRELK